MWASQSMRRDTTWQTSSSFWSKKVRGCLSFRMKSVFEAKKKDRTGFVGPFSFCCWSLQKPWKHLPLLKVGRCWLSGFVHSGSNRVAEWPWGYKVSAWMMLKLTCFSDPWGFLCHGIPCGFRFSDFPGILILWQSVYVLAVEGVDVW